jgi:peptidoglycan hydrolase-like protein with peptidoglycan-binding domain
MLLAVAAAIAVVLGAATGARADDPGGASAGTSSGTKTPSSTDPTPDTQQSAGRTLRRGMRGPDVKVLQQSLRKLGYRLRADGEYGTRTVRNVRRYERKQGLDIDGVVDPDEAQQITQDAGADADSSGTSDASGTSDTSATTPRAAGPQTTLNADGTASAPSGAPAAVQQIVQAGNEIADAPYEYGGGHTDDFKDSGYDCSGSVSYALHGANLLKAPLDSGEFMSWGDSGPGQWVTIYANEDHMYMVVAGLRFDTSGASESGSRWQTEDRSSSGYEVRHPPGL